MTLHELRKDLQRAREARGLMRRAVARRIGVSPATLAAWETTDRVPFDDGLRAWAAFLDVPVPPGVWGRLRAQCGTLGGYQRHRRNRTRPCDPCREKWDAYRRARNPSPLKDRLIRMLV